MALCDTAAGKPSPDASCGIAEDSPAGFLLSRAYAAALAEGAVAVRALPVRYDPFCSTSIVGDRAA